MVEQTDHTITVKQSSSKMSTTYSKRDVANSTELTKKVKVPKEKKVAKSGSVPKTSEQSGKGKRPKRKRQAIEGEKEPEDLGQVTQSEIELATNNPNRYIAPNPEDDQNRQWKEEKESTIPEPQEDEESSNGEPESTIPYAVPQEAENNQEKEDPKRIPVKGTVKWEKERNSAERARTSTRVTKKPDRWGNNIMVTRIEEVSSAENESLPTVIEIANPNPKK